MAQKPPVGRASPGGRDCRIWKAANPREAHRQCLGSRKVSRCRPRRLPAMIEIEARSYNPLLSNHRKRTNPAARNRGIMIQWLTPITWGKVTLPRFPQVKTVSLSPG